MENNKVEEKQKNRVVYIDIARGIAIILMIIGHVIVHGPRRNIIFSFHMPLFIIISGFFYKEKSFKDEFKEIMKYLIPTTFLLLLAFFIINRYNLGYIETYKNALKVITVCWSYEDKIDYTFDDVGVLWFIYVLVGIKVIFRLNKIVSQNDELFLFAIVMLETYLGFAIGKLGYWLPWSFDITLASMLFYYFGYILKKYSLLDKILHNKKIIFILLILWILGIYYNNIELATRTYLNGLWCYIAAIAGTMVVLKISMFIEAKIAFLTRILSWCGRNSLYILFGHYIENTIIIYSFPMPNLFITNIMLSGVKCFISFILCYLIIFIRNILRTILISVKPQEEIENKT